MEEIFEELRRGLDMSNKHIVILQAVYNNELDAKEICKITKIPAGRIYSYLNDLVDLRILEKSDRKPYLYSFKQVEKNVIRFLKHKFDNLVAKEQRVMGLLERRSAIEDVDIIESGDDFTFKLVQFIGESKYLKTVVRHGSIPFPLYPTKYEDFQKVRDAIVGHRVTLAHTTRQMTALIHRSYVDGYKKGKKFFALIEKSALDYNFGIIKKYLGKLFLRQMIKDIKERIKEYGMKMYIVDEYIPMQLFITNKKVLLSIVHLGVTTGNVIQSNRVVNLYKDFFEDMAERGKPIEEYLKKYRV